MEVGNNHFDIDKYFNLGIRLYNNEEYYLAHDCFEIVWKNIEKDKVFYQGLIQISVANYHYKKKNYKSAVEQYKKGIDKLKQYIPYYLKIDVLTIVNNSSSILSLLNGNSKTNCLIKIKKINKITLCDNLH